MNPQITRIGLLASSVVAAAALVACGGGGGASTSTPAPTPTATLGTLTVALTDAPACGFDAVNVTVSKVRVNKNAAATENDSGWTDITLSPAKKINLLNLTNGVLETLGQTSLEAGHYSQIRLLLDPNTNGTANTVVTSTGSKAELPLETPSAIQTGIKLVGEFDVAAGQKTDVVLDFDACKSVLAKGNGKYALKPVVKMVPAPVNGISGYVATALLPNHVVVTAQQDGKVISTTAPNPTTGEFFLSRLNPGNYDVVITADNSAASIVSAVPVASTTSTTSVSTSSAPINLAASNMGSVAGTVRFQPAPFTETAAYVAARQIYVTGKAVVIKETGADLATGAYTLANLPVAAPRYAVYSSTLPLTFAPSATSGKYIVSPSAFAYVPASGSAPEVDITAANQSNVNLTLVPFGP